MHQDKTQDILDFWFGTEFHRGLPAESRDKLWFSSEPALDKQIKDTFEQDVINASQGVYNDWQTSATGRLALIILLDQFPRNIYRKSARAFAFDSQAQALCLEGIKLGHDKVLLPIQQVFYYLPLEHSESLAHQEQCVRLCFSLLAEFPDIAAQLKGYADFAQLHLDIIKQFGRFPHRNKLLGRTSTPEEITYLAESGTSFGQA